MDDFQFILTVASILVAAASFIWLAFRINRGGATHGLDKSDLISQAKEDVDHIFNDDFREELRNRGRLHFEKIINENAMFLQQDLRLTTSQINEFMQEEIKRVLKQEFSKYEQSINSAKDQAIESIKKTQTAIEEQRQVLEEQVKKQVAEEKKNILEKFDKKMGEVLSHYIIDAIGNEIDLTDQLEFIFSSLEDNKQAILDDIKS